jgi:GDPmannose 4,6-dehydratase
MTKNLNQLSKKKIIITGALGQDGQILSKILIRKKYLVYGIIKKKSNNKIRGVIYKKINLINKKDLYNFLKKVKPDALVHLGTENPNYLQLKKKIDFYKKNFLATKNLIDYFSMFIPKKKLILIGSSQMYGNNIKKVNLKSRFEPMNSYAKFRAESYNYMLEKKKKFQSSITTAILFNHDSKLRKKKFLIPRLSKIIKNKNYKKLYDIYKENISGDFSHAEDICNGLFKLLKLKKSPNKLIFSSNVKTSINEIINFMLESNNQKPISKKLKILKTNTTPIGDNSYTKKILKWKLKKNIYLAAKEILLFN